MAKLKTGRHTSALKEVRKTHKRTARNISVKSEIRTAVKKLEDAIKNKDLAASKEILKEVFSKWDKASKRQVIHPKAAANKKGRLAKKVEGLK
jgi:small subunit ribosomal protein S20